MLQLTHKRTIHLFLYRSVTPEKCCVSFSFILPLYFHIGRLHTMHENCGKYLLIQLTSGTKRGAGIS